MSKWISVKDYLPSGDARVLVFTPNSGTSMRMRVVDADDVKILSDAYVTPVTHWKPLNPPVEDHD